MARFASGKTTGSNLLCGLKGMETLHAAVNRTRPLGLEFEMLARHRELFLSSLRTLAHSEPDGQVWCRTGATIMLPRMSRSRTETHRRSTSSQTDMPKYQPMPDLSPDEFEVLKHDVAENGIQIPVIQDEHGQTLDGHQRERAARELGQKNYPVKVIAGLTDEQKWQFALSVNVKRRHLSTAQKRTLIEQELRRLPDISNHWVAENLGVDEKTVLATRKKLESTSEIPKLTKLRGKDGRQRASKYSQVMAGTAREVEIARQIVTGLPPSSAGKTLDITTASRHARRHARAEERDERTGVPQANGDSLIRLYHCPFQKLEVAAKLKPKSVSLVITDIPYGKEFLPQITELGAFAAKVLKEGGIFATYSGHFHLPDVLKGLGEHLTYRWLITSSWSGEANMVWPYNLASQFKPILVFSKGKWARSDRWCDVLRPEAKEKDWHDWQQPLSEMQTLVGYFSGPDDLVCDPCAGGFTTALSCRRLGRKFIGCDVDARCVEKAHARLASAIAHPSNNRKLLARTLKSPPTTR
jgi:ParB-like chromosome segregation protein Spo0J